LLSTETGNSVIVGIWDLSVISVVLAQSGRAARDCLNELVSGNPRCGPAGCKI
jgi:hypothetical protein